MFAVDKIDYQTPEAPTSAGSTTIVFWTAFGVAAVVGVGIADVLDGLIYRFIRGASPDGGATLISMIGIPLSAIAAAVTRLIRRPKPGWMFATVCGLIAAPLLIVILYALF